MLELSEDKEKEIDEFLNTLACRIPDSSNDPLDPEEEMRMQERELGWLDFPQEEVE